MFTEIVSAEVVEAALAEERAALPMGVEIGKLILAGTIGPNWTAVVTAKGFASREPGHAAIRRVQSRYPLIDAATI